MVLYLRGDKWIEFELNNYQGNDPEELANHIVDMAEKRKNNSPDDDITAIAIKLEGEDC